MNDEPDYLKRKVDFRERAFSGDFFAKIAGRAESGEIFQYQFPGAPLKVEGFEEFDFVLHKSPDFTNDWSVSELLSGIGVARGESMELALADLLKNLDRVTPAKMRTMIGEAVKEGQN